MTLEELRKTLEGLNPGQMTGINHDVYADLFPPGESNENARAACDAFAKATGCSILNVPHKQTVWFIKDA
jgi:hypothetical protein